MSTTPGNVGGIGGRLVLEPKSTFGPPVTRTTSSTVLPRFTPMELAMALHYYYSPAPFPGANDSCSSLSISVSTGLERLEFAGLIKRRTAIQGMKAEFVSTEKLTAFVAMLRNTPLPLTGFIDPRTDRIINQFT